jgi:hypothetical protein
MTPDSIPEFTWNNVFLFTNMEEPESRQTVRIFGSENRARRGGSGSMKKEPAGLSDATFLKPAILQVSVGQSFSS